MMCPKCGKEMKNVLHFEDGRKYQYNKCPWCLYKTKNKRMHLEDDTKTKETK